MQIPEKLKERLKLLGLDESIYEQRSSKCILSRDPLELRKVPWYENAYIINDDYDKKHSFIFDPVSLLPCLALAPEKDDKILDMCAAPGTKTFILSFLTDNEAHIIANDIHSGRVRRLKGIVNKYNLSVEVLNKSGRLLKGEFDKILLDAPCTGGGMINKKEKTFQHWSEKSVKFLAKKQKKLIVHAFDLLKQGGTLVYSTCTFEPEENEEVVEFLLDKRKNAGLGEIDVEIIHEKGLTVYGKKIFSKEMEKCFRIYPIHNGTGGFFTAKISKN